MIPRISEIFEGYRFIYFIYHTFRKISSRYV